MPQPLNAPEHAPRAWPLWKPILFLLVVAVGLYYVKWQPYYGKAFVAADSHSIGKSILADGAASPWLAAWQYALVYFTAVWKAALLGVLLGSLVQVLIRATGWRARSATGVFPAPCWGADRAAGHDVHLLRRTGCRRHAPPVGIQRRRAGLLLANPVLNPATLVFMGFVLGWPFAAIRLVAGVVMVLGIAWLVQRVTANDPQPAAPQPPLMTAQSDERPFLARWGKALWALFWSTIPIYVLAVLALGRRGSGCSHTPTAPLTIACCGSSAWRSSAACSLSPPRRKSRSCRP